MSTSQAILAGWMEIPQSSVQDQARQRAEEEEALAALVSQYAATLYRVAFSVLRNPADAEDAVQETFLRVLRHRDTLAKCAITASGSSGLCGTLSWTASVAPKPGRRRMTWPNWPAYCRQRTSAEEITAAAQHHAACWLR